MKSVYKLVIWVLLATITSTVAAQDEELLEPDKAFALEVSALDNSRIAVRWNIADGYYMYRDKFKFSVIEGATLGEVKYPKGKTKHDEFFGDVEVYVQDAAFVMSLDQGNGNVILKLEGQGCNEPVGVCYPPIIKEIALNLPVVMTAESDPDVSAGGTADLAEIIGGSKPQASSTAAVDELRSLLGDLGGNDEFLNPDEAFKLNITQRGGLALAAQFQVADGYYLYQDKLKFDISSGDARTSDITLPKGKQKDDEYFGLMTVYLDDFEVNIPLLRNSADATTILLNASYQGCAEKGICYPPSTRKFTIELPNLVSTATASTAQTTTAAPPLDNSTGNSGNPVDRTFIGYLLAAFGVGVLLTFTPCVLPMIPILSSIIVGQGKNATRAKGGLLSFIYVVGTTVTYAAIGWVAGATGDQLQAYFQNIWTIGVLSLIFVLMALSMFGLYKIQIPSFIQSRMQEKSSGIQGGTIGMVFVLGLMSALIVGACVSPLLISLLSIAISQGDALLGASMMVAMSLGMGIFLVAIGFGAGFLLPKAGAWMDYINYVFGVMLIAVAIYLLNAIPAVPVLLFWAALLIVTGVYMGATQALSDDAGGWRYLFKGIGTILLVWGVLALIGGLNGNRDIMNPLPLNQIGMRTGSGMVEAVHEELFIQVSNTEQLDSELQRARDAGKHVMLDFYADWCTDCIRMEKTTFLDADVRRLFDASFVLVQVDLTDPNAPGGKAIKKRYSVYGPPAMLFFRGGENEVRDLRLYGYRNKDAFLEILKQI